MPLLPETIEALQIRPEKGVRVVQIPFASQDLVKHLPSDQVIIRVRAVGLNPTDWKHALSDLGTPGTISGCDSAGDVVKVGSAVKHLKVGDRAAGFTFGGSYQTENGSYSEYVRLVAAVCFKFPESMTYEEAASFPIPHLTAVQALYIRLNLPKPLCPNPKREAILIWGGSTAVGHHAVQLAALSGLRVFVTASPAAHEELKTLGAEACFDYKDTDVVQKIQAAAGEEGIIYSLDTVCEHGSTDNCVDALSPSRGGRIISILPVPEDTQKRRKDVRAEFTLAYTMIGFSLNLGHFLDLPAMPEHKNAILEYVSTNMPHILENWEEGQGSPKFKTQHLRHLEGGLEKIYEGLEIMRDGRYGREKLVYTLA
ncbi:chaperonin 10-like protein [Rhodocollybia butyracea]|uniref:Chaperonin 10-like protein n=1 Tax=Rhodocollybia butyracea TaxID=206335 RepID=A0A9P5PVM1_9AGAR|nr:chaperonin 10-like protein [Rhodocollybia butyracea]